MAQTDPFTLDLFGGTALSSSLGLDATAFAGGFAKLGASRDEVMETMGMAI